MFDAGIAKGRQVDAFEEPFASAQQDRRDGDVHLVNKALAKVLLDDVDAPAHASIPGASGFAGGHLIHRVHKSAGESLLAELAMANRADDRVALNSVANGATNAAADPVALVEQSLEPLGRARRMYSKARGDRWFVEHKFAHAIRAQSLDVILSMRALQGFKVGAKWPAVDRSA